MNAGMSFRDQSCWDCRHGRHVCDDSFVGCECRIAGHPDAEIVTGGEEAAVGTGGSLPTDVAGPSPGGSTDPLTLF